jgi:hypothetical protein
MQRRQLAQSGGLVVARGPVVLTLHASGAAELVVDGDAADLSAEQVEALLLALRAPGVAGLITRAALRRQRADYAAVHEER